MSLSYMKCSRIGCEKARNIGAAFCDEHSEPVQETGWLIERDGLCLGFCDRKWRWVAFTNERALRLARRSDAVRFVEAMRDELHLIDVLITEHLWTADPIAEAGKGSKP